jgi:hypothetical protein
VTPSLAPSESPTDSPTASPTVSCDGSLLDFKVGEGVDFNVPAPGSTAVALPGQFYQNTLVYGCLPGYSSADGITFRCEAEGRFVKTAGSPCTRCLLGSYCTGGIAPSALCPRGTIGLEPGLGNRSGCTDCVLAPEVTCPGGNTCATGAS